MNEYFSTRTHLHEHNMCMNAAETQNMNTNTFVFSILIDDARKKLTRNSNSTHKITRGTKF